MAFTWPGKKEPQDPPPKREFPAALEIGLDNDDAGRKDDPPRASGPGRDSGSKDDAAGLQELGQRLDQLGRLLDETKGQVAAYLTQHDTAEALAEKLDALAQRRGQSGEGVGNRSLDQKLDALYGKLEMLASATGRSSGGSDAGAPAASEAVLKTALRPVAEKIDQMETKFKTLDALKEAFVPNLVKVRDTLHDEHTTLHTGIGQVQQQVTLLPQYLEALRQQLGTVQQRTEVGLREIINILRPPQPEPSSGAAISGDWQEAILGEDLAASPALAGPRRQLLQGVLSGEPAACSLAGQLLVFRSSPAEKMPTLLKDVGEAFYRWQPRTAPKPSEMERALVAWLQRTCDQAGVSNTIELVHPGERFDSARHNATERGVEITQVLGWIVLRDNGKVYTKASVAVK